MNLSAVVIEGTRNDKGELQLDQKPNLPAGRVTVILQPVQVSTAGKRGLAEVIDEIRQSQQAGFATHL